MKADYLLEPPNTTGIYIDLSKKCIATLEAALEDKGWIASWYKPAETVREIKKQIAFFKRILKDPKFNR